MKNSNQNHTVLSASGKNFYSVISQMEGESIEHTCSCSSFSYHKNVCKHIAAVRIFMKIQNPIAEATVADTFRAEKVMLLFVTINHSYWFIDRSLTRSYYLCTGNQQNPERTSKAISAGITKRKRQGIKKDSEIGMKIYFILTLQADYSYTLFVGTPFKSSFCAMFCTRSLSNGVMVKLPRSLLAALMVPRH